MTSRTIMKEVIESRFDEFPLEVTWWILMDCGQESSHKVCIRVTKFQICDIKERFEETAPFLEQQEDDYELSNRPKKGEYSFLWEKNVWN